MKQSQNHIVDRLNIELKISSPKQAHDIQEEVSQLMEQKLQGMLEGLFNQVPGDKTIVIDHLQFDLGTLSSSRFPSHFIEKLQKEVKQKIPGLIHMNSQKVGGVQQLTTKELYWETFRHYLLTGSYPWFVSRHTNDKILRDPVELYEVIVRENKTDLINFLKKNGGKPNVRKRLIYLLNKDQFELLKKNILTGTEDYDRLKKNMIKAGAKSALVEAGLINVVLATVGGNPKHDEILKLFFEPFAEQGHEEQLLYRIDQLYNDNNLGSNILSESLIKIIDVYRLLKLLRKEASQDDIIEAFSDFKETPDYLGRIKTRELTPREMQALEEEVSQKLADKIGIGEEISSETKQKSAGKENESFYITNGGLILLWPFLPKFFRSLELTAEREFIDQISQLKAIHILQYLASGAQATYEYVMVLNKILCGYPIERSFSAKVKFSDHEVEEADELLLAVINQWEALKNTSVQGLREGFIHRDARLTEQSDQWQLQIGSKGYDMLLDKLPWGISVVRLPWMEKPIYVNWR